MLNRHSRMTAGLALALATGLVALPACDKKKPSDSGPPPNSGGYKAGGGGSAGGPPPGFGPKKGGQGGQPDEHAGGKDEHTGGKAGGKDEHAGGKTGDQHAVAGLPAPPAKGPLLQSSDEKSRLLSQNNLRQIGLAFQNYHSTMGNLTVGIADSTGKPGLSWRVALLPYLEQLDLYKQFKLNEPWDSENNKKLIAKMPKVYAPPGLDTHGYTYYRSFSGGGAIMTASGKAGKAGEAIPGMKLAQITDGTAFTLLAAEASEPEIWTKPDDLPFSPGKPPKLGGSVFTDGFNGAMCDGSVKFIKGTIDEKTLSNLIQVNDGNMVKLP